MVAERVMKKLFIVALGAILGGLAVIAANAQETHTILTPSATYRVGPAQYLIEVTLKDGTRCILYGSNGVTCNWAAK